MAALPDQKSTEYTAQTGADRANGGDVDAGLRVSKFHFTNGATAGAPAEIDLVKLPAGKVTVYPDLCRLVSSDEFQANADLHVGHRAYREPDGTVVSEDDNAFLDNEDAGGAALDKAFALPAGGEKVFESVDGVIIYALIDTADMDAAADISGYVVWSKAGN